MARDLSLRKAPIPNAKPRSAFWPTVFREAYARQMDPRDPRMSPIYADTSNYPANMLILTAERDSLALEAEELAEKAAADGGASRNVMIRRMKGCGHDFDKIDTDSACVQARDEAYGLAVNMLKKVAGESS